MRKKHTMLLSLCCSEGRSAITETETSPPRRVLPPLRRVGAALRFTSRRLVLAALLGCAFLFSGGEALGADPTGTLKITPSKEQACIVYRGSGEDREEIIFHQNYVLVGATVRADISDIADGDGIDNTSWSYKWKRVRGNGNTETVVGTDETYEVKVADWSASYWYYSASYLVLEATYTDNASNEHTVLTSTDYPSGYAYRVVRPVSPPVPSGWDSSYTYTHPRSFETHTVYVYDVPEGSSSVTLAADLSEYGAGPVDYRTRDTRGSKAEWDKDNSKFKNNYPNTKSPTFTFKEAPDFEEPNDENGDNDYRLAIAMKDSGADNGGGYGPCRTGWKGEDDTKVYPIKIRVTDALEQDDLLDTPDDPTLESVTFDSATVTWTAPGRRDPVIPQATGYELEWRKAPSDQVPDPAVQQESLTVTTKTLSGLQESTTYNVRVRATNGYAGSPWSDWLSFTIPRQEEELVVLSVPVLFSRDATPESVMLQWIVASVNGLPPGTTYDLEYREKDAHSTQTESGLTETARTLEGLQPGVTYEARVRISPDNTWSEWHTFTTPEKEKEGEKLKDDGGDEPKDDDRVKETDEEERETDEEEREYSCPDAPETTARDLENNQNRETLKGFVKEALCSIRAELEASGQEGFRDQDYSEDGRWRHGSVYLFLISDDGTVVFDGFHEELNGEELHAVDHKGNNVWDKISGAVEENGYGYAEYYWDDPSTEDDDNQKPEWLEDGESPGTSLKRVYVEEFSTSEDGDFIVGSGIYLDEAEEEGMEDTSGGDGGSGCAVAGSKTESAASGLFLTLAAILFCIVLRRGRSVRMT